jgi:hypothetical protein
MDKLLKQIKNNSKLLTSIHDCELEVTPILQGFITNFPDYTDHSINHSKTVLGYAGLLLADELKELNEDEIYILIMAGFLHDIGMCPTSQMKKEIKSSSDFKESGKKFEDYLRDIHHELSYKYITTHWKKLKIINEIYAEAIGLVGMGHRVVNLLDFDRYKPEFSVKTGEDFVCLPYLAGILRLADELDITNDRTPELLYSEYLPNNKISKKEWEKHKANYVVGFNKNKGSIIITSKCYEKDLYYALLKQYNKIEEVIKYAQKIVHTIPQNERKLQVTYSKLEKDIQTFGFIPKEIGFTFDLQNTINTFIGDNIYKDKFVAIRECLQNAIDSCRYKKQLSKTPYLPKISVALKDKKLVISDNGMGMDEFIVANYFSKLAKSYYTEIKVSAQFEAISQFGIGVFSYFLLCDYFEVETKQDGKPPVKFRATKSADNYFYFYDDSAKKTNGTEITIYLSNEVDFDNLLDQIRHYIRFVEFPLEVKYLDRHEIIVSEDFSIDKLKMLGKRIDRSYLSVLEQLAAIESHIDNDYCEGTLGLLMPVDEDGVFIPVLKYETIKTINASNIELSQKGIFIGNTSEETFKHVIGKINLKRKNQIDLGRYRIKNHLPDIFEPFYFEILTKLFKNWELLSPSERVTFTTKFIDSYFEYDNPVNLRLIEKFYDDLYFSVFKGSKIEHFTLKQILEFDVLFIVNHEIPISSNNVYNYSTVGEIYQELKSPLVLQNNGLAASVLLSILKARKNVIEVKCTNRHWYLFVRPSVCVQEYSEIFAGKYEGYSFDKPHICAYPALYLERPFNINHKILAHYFSCKSKISSHQRLFNSYDEFFRGMESFIYDFHNNSYDKKNPTSEIKYLNSKLIEINNLSGTDFELVSNDFPSWMNEKIMW